MLDKEIIQKIANTIRVISAEMIQRANSGHPGLPLGCAEIGAVLWTEIMKYNPNDPIWINRDRFILSAGHGSAFLYSLLHFAGYTISIEDLKNFRQLHSKTPGHPEYGITPGVETTTGPLGQGFANAVGMALARNLLKEKFNKENFSIIDHYIYVLMGDGCMMEGITSEAASLAGHLKLDKLIAIYDDNNITIEGHTSLAFSEDVETRFKAYGWEVMKINDGHNIEEIYTVINKAKEIEQKPVLIIAKTIIGKGSPNMAGSHEVHGAPLGEDELKAMKESLGFPQEEFFVPSEVYETFKQVVKKNEEEYRKWKTVFEEWKNRFPELWKEWENMENLYIPEDIEKKLPDFSIEEKIATRSSSGKVLAVLGKELPWLYGGSADLAPSNKTIIPSAGDVKPSDFKGKNLHFGIREHAMGGIVNGMALYGMIKPYAATFLVFSDYMRPSIRLSALMKLPVVYIFTHDSIYVGEDGPTHQPVEHMCALRCIPGLTVIRPADANEVKQAWMYAIRTKEEPVALVLTRQSLPTLEIPDGMVERGGYILKKEEGDVLQLILIASGSEIHLALEVYESLAKEGYSVRVVSMPSFELFEKQDSEYKRSVLPEEVRNRCIIEASSTFGLERYAGLDGIIIGMNSFGASGPYKEVGKYFGFSKDNIVDIIKKRYF